MANKSRLFELNLDYTAFQSLWFYFVAIALACTPPLAANANTCESVFAQKPEPKIERASFVKRAQSKLILTTTALMFEPFVVSFTLTKAIRNRAATLDFLNKFDRTDTIKYRSLPELIRASGLDQVPVRKLDWGSKKLFFGTYGSNLSSKPHEITIESLRAHFSQKLPLNLQKVANDFVDQVFKAEKVDAWITRLRQEVFERMWEDGLRNPILLTDPGLRELYVDSIITDRALTKGFKGAGNGLPADVYTFNPISFFHGNLSRGKIFIDWTGIDLVADDHSHYARGHLLAMGYAAEHVPNFIELTKYIGRTGDSDGLWSMLFDNTHSVESPLWGGAWVDCYGLFLGIRY